MSRFEQVKKDLIRLEDWRNKPYKCTSNKLTIGVGRNLEDKGLSDLEIDFLLDNDITDTYIELKNKIPFFGNLPDDKQDILVNMAFQMGVEGLLRFRKTLSYIYAGDYKKASVEMLDSLWAKQTPARAKELSKKLKA